LEDWLMEMRARGFVFEEDGHYVALATSTIPRKQVLATVHAPGLLEAATR
jgi:hypothetical protein